MTSNWFPKTRDVSARSLLQLGVSPRLQCVCSHSNACVYSGCARYILERFDNSSVSSKSWFFEYPCKFIKILIKSLILCHSHYAGWLAATHPWWSSWAVVSNRSGRVIARCESSVGREAASHRPRALGTPQARPEPRGTHWSPLATSRRPSGACVK